MGSNKYFYNIENTKLRYITEPNELWLMEQYVWPLVQNARTKEHKEMDHCKRIWSLIVLITKPWSTPKCDSCHTSRITHIRQNKTSKCEVTFLAFKQTWIKGKQSQRHHCIYQGHWRVLGPECKSGQFCSESECQRIHIWSSPSFTELLKHLWMSVVDSWENPLASSLQWEYGLQAWREHDCLPDSWSLSNLCMPPRWSCPNEHWEVSFSCTVQRSRTYQHNI